MRALALFLLTMAAACAQPSEVISKNADPSLETVKIVIVGDGWTAKNMDRYKKVCLDLYDNITNDPMIERMKKFIRFTRYDVVSEDEGCTRLFCTPALARRTALKVTYSRRGTFAPPNCPPARIEVNKDVDFAAPAVPFMPEEGMRALYNIAKYTDRTLIFIVCADSDVAIAWQYTGALDLPIGTNERGGQIRLNQAPHGVIFCTPFDISKRDGGASKVLVHELGHAIWGLGDEYFSPGDTCNLTPEMTDADLPPNLSIAGAKWQHLIDAGIVGKPVDGGWMGCANGIVHPTATCKMLDNTSDFCVVCEEAIGHGKMTRSRLVKSRTPSQLIVQSQGNSTLTFRVECALNILDGCPDQFPYYWELDGQRLYGSKDSPTTYSITLKGVGVGGLKPGSHKLRFSIADKSLFCRHPPTDQSQVGVLPWDTCEWWLDVRLPCASLSGQCLPTMDTDQSF